MVIKEEIEIYFNPRDSIGPSHADPDNETGIGNTITIKSCHKDSCGTAANRQESTVTIE